MFLHIFPWLDSSLLFLLLFKNIPVFELQCTTVDLSIHSLKDILAASKFWQLKSSYSKYLRASFCVDISFQLFGKIPKSVIAELYGKTMFSFLRICQTVF